MLGIRVHVVHNMNTYPEHIPNGGAVMIGRELGIPAPINFTMYAGLKPYENGRL
jgi:ketopantoate reductase